MRTRVSREIDGFCCTPPKQAVLPPVSFLRVRAKLTVEARGKERADKELQGACGRPGAARCRTAGAGAGPVYRREGAGCCTAPCTPLLLPHPGYTVCRPCTGYTAGRAGTAVPGPPRARGGRLGSTSQNSLGRGAWAPLGAFLCLVSSVREALASRTVCGI